MKIKSICFLFCLAATMMTTSEFASAQNIAVVNGKAIPPSAEEALIAQINSQPNPPKDTPELRAKIKEELISREVFAQAAEKKGLDKTKEFKEQVEDARQSIMIRALVLDYVKKNPATQQEIQAEYDKEAKLAGDKEYHVRHILVATAVEANDLISKLKAGESFDELAKQSKDSGTANIGGDLNWATPARFVKPFSDAMVGLQKGQMTETPVQSPYGFHIIRVDDIRPFQLPPLDSKLAQQISQRIEQNKIQAFREDLRKKAVIK